MRILAIETTATEGGVAALDGHRLLLELPLGRSTRGAQSLAPTVAETLRRAGWKPSDVRLVAVAVGPGSFTSLRVGVTTAKTFAYAVSAAVLGVGTLEVVAAQATDVPPGGPIAVAIDAQRGDVYAALFRRRAQFAVEIAQPPAIVAADQWLASLTGDTVATGPALEKLADRLSPGIRAAAPCHWRPMASTVGLLAAAKFEAGQRGDVWSLNPMYLRKSAAEERR